MEGRNRLPRSEILDHERPQGVSIQRMDQRDPNRIRKGAFSGVGPPLVHRGEGGCSKRSRPSTPFPECKIIMCRGGGNWQWPRGSGRPIDCMHTHIPTLGLRRDILFYFVSRAAESGKCGWVRTKQAYHSLTFHILSHSYNLQNIQSKMHKTTMKEVKIRVVLWDG